MNSQESPAVLNISSGAARVKFLLLFGMSFELA
jgi:hypothetical protein